MPLLQEPTPGLWDAAAAMSAGDPAALDAALDALDPDEWSELEQLIGTASTRSVRTARSRQATEPPVGDVILLPGVMGTDLGVVEAGVATALWFNVLALTRGGLAKLRLPVDGSAPAFDIVTGGPLKLFYLPMQMTLNQRFRTRLFPYDWRLDITTSADRLADEIARIDSPVVHLVAHSMGGLVSRAMIQRHPEVWQRMGGRLVMLGTPNHGSFAPVLALTGKDRKLRLLALLDATASKRKIVDIVATFPGLAQMLPSGKVRLEPPVDALYERDSWPDTPVHQPLLDLARETHELLHDVIDTDRMIYIAGYGHATVDGVERKSGRFRYRRSRAGDGTVPHVLGRLAGVPTYWTPANHGGLAKDESVLTAVSELLTDGATNRLPLGDRPPAARGGAEETWIDDDELESEVMRAVDRAHATGRDIDLLDDVLPAVTPTDVQVPITIEVVWGGIGSVAADVVAVGHYEGVYPTSSELALDEALSGSDQDRPRLLHAATSRGVLRGSLGDVFLVPWRRDGTQQVTAAVLGLGRPGSFQLPQHEVLVRNMVWTAERVLEATSVACVLIGSGAGNLSVDDTVDSLLRALDAAVRERELTGQLELIRIVEVELGRARTILQALQRAVGGRDRAIQPAIVDVVQELRDEGGKVDVETALGAIVQDLLDDDPDELGERIARREPSRRVVAAMVEALPGARRSGGAYVVSRQSPAPAKGVPTRLSVLSVDGRLVASAVTDSATVPEREFGLGEDLFIQLVDLANAQAAGDPAVAGRMLLRVAIPSEFRPLLDLDRDVIIEVDRVTAALPWEVLGSDAGAAVQLRPLGLRSPLARQLRTRRSPPPAVTGRVVLSRALIIGDPAGGAGHLPGAEREARAVADMLYERGVPFDVLLGPQGATDPDKRWNARPATLANVLHQLLHYEYQLVHYAGHGTFAAADAARGSGWLLADGLLTGEHLTIIDRLPALVVANACHSSRVATDLPGLAEEFMSHGVRNLVGTARTVDDESASQFSLAFYTRLLDAPASRARAGLGSAVLAGRLRLAEGGLRDWDVYQLYGDPTFRLWFDASDDS